MAVSTVTSWDELPLLLSVSRLVEVLGVSRDAAYSLPHQQGFPTVRIGKRILVPKDGLRRWLEEQTTTD